MGRIRELSITLSGSKLVYYAGEHIKGYVTVHLDKERVLKSIRIRVLGEVSCVWTELAADSSVPDSAALVAFTSANCILDNTILLANKSLDKPDETFVQEAGKQLYDFSYQLAPGLPSSMEGAHGYVRYCLKATIEEATGDLFHSKNAFTLLTYIDVNERTFIKQPGGEISNASGPKCCPSGWICMRAFLDRAAYCPGESIFVSARIENTSKYPIPSITIQLEKKEIYKALTYDGDATQLEEKVNGTFIASVRSPGVPPNEDYNIDDQEINIPVTEPSLKAGLISIEYFIHVLLQVHKNANLRLVIPLVVGTVPFRGLKKKVGSHFSLKSQGSPPEFLPISGARGLRIREDRDGEYLFVTDNYLPHYPCAVF